MNSYLVQSFEYTLYKANKPIPLFDHYNKACFLEIILIFYFHSSEWVPVYLTHNI